jgi:hypothetical protein
MRFYRFNLDTNVEYELLRASADAALGYLPPSTSISPYASAPVDQKGRVVLNLIDSTPGYGLLAAGAGLLVAAGKAKELTQDEYDASFFPAPSGGGGGVSSWNDLADKPVDFPPSAHTQAATTVSVDGGYSQFQPASPTVEESLVAISNALSFKQKTITSGTALPSGGNDGDFYIQYPG